VQKRKRLKQDDTQYEKYGITMKSVREKLKNLQVRKSENQQQIYEFPEKQMQETRKPREVFEKIPANVDIKIKIGDLGNSRFIEEHDSSLIQTQEYRAIEVLIRAEFGPSVDVWSTACMAYELATGYFLFRPSGADATKRDKEQIAMIIGMLGDIPKEIALSGRKSSWYFDENGKMNDVSAIDTWSLFQYLTSKYNNWEESIARKFEDFLKPMLNYNPKERVLPAQLLDDPWLQL